MAGGVAGRKECKVCTGDALVECELLGPAGAVPAAFLNGDGVFLFPISQRGSYSLASLKSF